MPASGKDILNKSEIHYIACGGLCAMKKDKHNDTPALNASRHWAAPLEVEREESCGGCKPAARSSYCHCVGELCRIGAFCVEKDGGKYLIADHSSVERVAAIIL